MVIRVIGTASECEAFFAIIRHPSVIGGVAPEWRSMAGAVSLWQRIQSGDVAAYLVVLDNEPAGMAWFEGSGEALRAHIAFPRFSKFGLLALTEIHQQVLFSFGRPLEAVFDAKRKDVEAIASRFGFVGEPGNMKREV